MTKIRQVNLLEMMPKVYIDYASEVITNRALPDVRDGLKPVVRRILYAMDNMGIYPEKPYKKSARIVGEVLGKYHPHGDSSVYDAMVRLSQGFTMRYPLINGHGNFGSIDGDGAAAMRYTEAKLHKIALEMTKRLKKDTVDFVPNFDGEEEEPSVLPSRFPNLLVNGTTGIAVGFASDMPPHNLNEVIDGVKYRLKNKDCTLEEVMTFIKAPDFPTGAVIINPREMESIYKQGRGKIIIRGMHHIETLKEGNKDIEAIVITEVPYQTNKAKLVEEIDLLSSEIEKEERGKRIKIKAKIPEIVDVRDESDRNGIRIVVELKKKGDSDRVLQLLYKYSKLQKSFNVNNVALVNGLPVENLSLLELIDHYISHQKDITTREVEFDLNKAEKKFHILKGIITALNKIDLTIQLIKNSKSKVEAKEKLIKELGIDGIQSNSILEMKLQKLTGLEKELLQMQLVDIEKEIYRYRNILNNEDLLIETIINELNIIKDKFGDDRRTRLIEGNYLNKELLAEQYNVDIQITKSGYIKKIRSSMIKGNTKNKLKEGDYIIKEVKGRNRDTLILFSNMGNAYKIKASELAEIKTSELGELINNYFEIDENEKIINVISTSFEKDEFIFEVFNNGKIAKIDIESFNKSVRKIKFNPNGMIDIKNSKDTKIFLLSSNGKGLIVDTQDLNSKVSRSTQGVTGIKLKDGDVCVGCKIGISKDDSFNLYTNNNREIYIHMDNVSANENKNIFDYISGRATNQGNHIFYSSSKNVKVDKINFLK